LFQPPLDFRYFEMKRHSIFKTFFITLFLKKKYLELILIRIKNRLKKRTLVGFVKIIQICYKQTKKKTWIVFQILNFNSNIFIEQFLLQHKMKILTKFSILEISKS
jgi:hypothetical protein